MRESAWGQWQGSSTRRVLLLFWAGLVVCYSGMPCGLSLEAMLALWSSYTER